MNFYCKSFQLVVATKMVGTIIVIIMSLVAPWALFKASSSSHVQSSSIFSIKLLQRMLSIMHHIMSYVKVQPIFHCQGTCFVPEELFSLLLITWAVQIILIPFLLWLPGSSKPNLYPIMVANLVGLFAPFPLLSGFLFDLILWVVFLLCL